MLKILGVSKSGYYDYLKRKPSDQKIRKSRVKKEIIKTYEESHQNYGAPKIAHILNQKGENISERTVGVYMKEMGIKAQWVKKKTRTTVNSDLCSTLTNVLQRDFAPERPNAAWCTDITYIWTQEDGFVYLTSVMDLYSRRIIAWTLSKTLEVEQVLECIKTARNRRKTDEPVILHSDRGVHFTCSLYSELTQDMKRSYSAKANPWDNACIESFHSLIKREWLGRFRIVNFRHAWRLCFEYIENFYNTKRIHSHCQYNSPRDWELQWKAQKQEIGK